MMKGVASTLQQVIKFVTPQSEETLYGDQVAAKQCYLAIVSIKAAIQEVQLIEEEHEVLEDIKRDPEAKVMEDLIWISQSQTVSFLPVQTWRNGREPSSSSFLTLISRSSHGHLTKCLG